jgi:hypothetical protein
MDEQLMVVIQKQPGNPNRCTANAFRARPDSTVRFLIVGEDQATIEFPGNNSEPDPLFDTPFAQRVFTLTQIAAGVALSDQKVRSNAPPRSFGYQVTWSTGMGNGGGEVLPSRQ